MNFFTLSVIYLVYSFLGWVAETVVATIRGGRFANRGVAAGPFCFIYGLHRRAAGREFRRPAHRAGLPVLFLGCDGGNGDGMDHRQAAGTPAPPQVVGLFRQKFNLNGYVCLQYSLLWGALGTASVLWGNDVLLRLCAHIPSVSAARQYGSR